ncbi:MAG: CotH kinase family protein [Granulosicoccus sp.]|nr:CotH kinase family protein [Granulosicoccus sp.]
MIELPHDIERPGLNPGIDPGTDPGTDPEPENPNSVFQPHPSDLSDNLQLYQQDGYADQNTIRVDLRTATSGIGPCVIDDMTGCTLADVIADINPNDDFKVDIPVHFSSFDYPNDGLISNAELRQRGGGTRNAPQKSFRLKLDDSDRLWRTERHLQLNKHPFESKRIRNKLSFDLMSEIPHLLSFRTQFVNLWIDNGQGPEDFGLFTHVERADKRYLERRSFNPDGNLYKAKLFRFRENELNSLLIDSEGDPVNTSIFETVLEIESGNDHRKLIEMMEALHDPTRSFQSVLDQYFNENNVLTWITVNLLLGQYDAVRHNYFLYNPLGSDKFYFLPWDYDTSFIRHIEPEDDLGNSALRTRLEYGYANGSRNYFLSSYYKLPGVHEKIIDAADEIRQNYLTDLAITERADHYGSAVATYATSEPDSLYNSFFSEAPGVQFAATVADNHLAISNRFSYPLPPVLDDPALVNGQWQFSWQSAYDVTGNSISYDLDIATSVNFEPDSIVVSITDISDTGNSMSQSIADNQLSTGTHYARLIARASNEPMRFWQVADNQLESDGTVYYGVVEFLSP